MTTVLTKTRARVGIEVVVEGNVVRVPAWVKDHESFRRWARSDEFPERGRISYLNGEVVVDLTMERLEHGLIKNEIAFGLTALIKAGLKGRYLPDRMMLTNAGAGVSNEPDGMFFLNKSLAAGHVRLTEGVDSLEVEGAPDMVLEVVSDSSVRKDTVELRALYWAAGIPEYWLVNPLGDTLEFDILRRTAKGYVPVRKQAGWVKSTVFGKSFRLTLVVDATGLPEYTLEVR
jgi:Uma2 family endonuclease